jgi:hypothetical protein
VKIVPRVNAHLVSARRPRQLHLVVAPDRREHPRAPPLRQLNQDQPDASGARMDQRTVFRLQRKCIRREVRAVMPCSSTAAASRELTAAGTATHWAAGASVSAA